MKSQGDGTKLSEQEEVVAIVPLKELRQAKSRLSPVLKGKQKEQFVLSMMTDVLAALRNSEYIGRILLVTREENIEMHLDFQGIDILSDSADRDLNSALHTATTHAARLYGEKPLIVIPADVPLINESDIDTIISRGGEGSPFVVAAPSHNWGTNALLRNPPAVIDAKFGPSSFKQHRNSAHQKGIPFLEYHSPRIALDIDTPDDIKAFSQKSGDNATSRFLQESGTIQSYFS
ncbi:MAG: 2-phospho-L-lactate guanylyltransferase [Candidatus Thorarchaeota archaeon]